MLDPLAKLGVFLLALLSAFALYLILFSAPPDSRTVLDSLSDTVSKTFAALGDPSSAYEEDSASNPVKAEPVKADPVKPEPAKSSSEESSGSAYATFALMVFVILGAGMFTLLFIGVDTMRFRSSKSEEDGETTDKKGLDAQPLPVNILRPTTSPKKGRFTRPSRG